MSVQDQRVMCHRRAQNQWKKGEHSSSLVTFSSASSEKRGKTKERKMRKPGKSLKGVSPRSQKLPQDVCTTRNTQLIYGSFVLLCPSPVGCPGRYLWRHCSSWVNSPFLRVCWDQEQGLRLQDLAAWDLSWSQDCPPSHISNITKLRYHMDPNRVLQPAAKQWLLHLFSTSVKKFLSQNHPFVACITECMKHQHEILQTLGVIFTTGVDSLQFIGVINTMSSLYRTRAKLLLVVTLEDLDLPHLFLQI